MPNLEVFLSRGYFPIELPPSFTTRYYGSFLTANHSSLPSSFYQNSNSGKILSHNLARSGSLRRKLGIPNAVHFYSLAMFVIENWHELYEYASRSSFSLTTPVDGLKRSLERQYSLSERPVRRAQLRSISRYILHADISRFYPSIYTHSIPWAIHTKAIAKANQRNSTLIGNRLDRLVRSAQDNQTMGIPIGPDTSLLIAEIILSAVDTELSRRRNLKGFRYIDDYEFGFSSLSETEESLAIFQEVLNDYELALNPNKTKIIKLPVPIEPLAISELRTFNFRTSISGQQSDILRYFDRAFYLSNKNPEEGVLKYAISRLSGVDFHSSNYKLLEKLLLQCIMAEAGAISFALNQILRHRDSGCTLDRERIGQAFNKIIEQHAPLGHGSEVSWALWGCLVLRLPIDNDSVSLAATMNDSVVAILLLDVANKSLVNSGASFNSYQPLMTTEELYGEQWLLSYEANIKGWLPSRDTSDHVTSDACFSFLKRNGICFYDHTLSEQIGYTPPEGWGASY